MRVVAAKNGVGHRSEDKVWVLMGQSLRVASFCGLQMSRSLGPRTIPRPVTPHNGLAESVYWPGRRPERSVSCVACLRVSMRLLAGALPSCSRCINFTVRKMAVRGRAKQ